LHLNPLRHDAEQLVVQSLFADGYIRYSLGPPGGGIQSGFTVLGFLERLIPDSLEDIGWIPGNFGMRMTLSRNVPDKIALVLEPFLTALAAECGCSRDDLREAIYAVHPGGPRIMDKVGEWLNLVPSQLQASREILFERGNMSSATLPHIWERLLKTSEMAPKMQPGTLVVSLAFGPGLTIYGSLMRTI
jgi:predicted naringenin-chalcone synthase